MRLRHTSLLAALAFAVLPSAAAQSPSRPEVRIALTADPAACHMQQLVQLRLQVRIDEQALRTQLLQLFQHHLELPIQIDTHGLERDPRLLARGSWSPLAAAGAPMQFALGERIVRAPTRRIDTADGRREIVVELALVVLPQQAGALPLPAPTASFAYATQFEEDFARGRVALDRHDVTVEADALQLDVAALPPAPPGFTSAVGTFTIGAELLPRDGAALRVALTIRGEGNFETLEPPRLDELSGFHVLGRIDLRSGTQCTFRYELQPTGPQARELPAIPFRYFDPTPPAGYRLTQTEPLALPATTATPPAGSSADPLRPLKPARMVAPPTAAGRWSAWLALLAPWVLAGGCAAFVQARRRAARFDPAALRARHAHEVLTTHLATPDADPRTALVEFLAARLRVSAEVVTGPNLTRRLTQAGVPPAVAERTMALLGELTAAQYGGSAPERAVADVQELAAAVEAQLASAEADA